MLGSFDFAVITYPEAKVLAKYIEDTNRVEGSETATYKKMQAAGVYKVYHELRRFIERSEHYNNKLSSYSPHDPHGD